jgi:GxxExxY protein
MTPAIPRNGGCTACSADGYPQMTKKIYPQMTQMDADKRDPRTYAIIGAAMEVHIILGCGFLEAVYQDALAIEFERRAIPFRREASFRITYKNQLLSAAYKADFLCFGTIIAETKALARLSPTEEAQIINYLKASDGELGLLFNFGASRLEHRRFILSTDHLRPSAYSISLDDRR